MSSHDMCQYASCEDSRNSVQADSDDVCDEIKRKWEREQEALKSRLVLEDSDAVQELTQMIDSSEGDLDKTFYVGGVDVSFVKGDSVNACAALVVVEFPNMKVVYEDYQMVELTAPYIAGFLAFREVGFLVGLVDRLRETRPEYLPHVIMVDGNGLLHVRGFGLACQLGVLLDLPCIGVAKTLYQIDGLEKNTEHTEMIKDLLKKGGDTFPLVGLSGTTLGMALRSHDSSTNPIYISQGHKVSLESCVKIVYRCCKYRIPEPVRKADINSREYLRVNFKPS